MNFIITKRHQLLAENNDKSKVYMGGKELLDLIGRTIFSEGEDELMAHADPAWPDTGTYAAQTMFMRELYG
jgi:hypothetical protein